MALNLLQISQCSAGGATVLGCAFRSIRGDELWTKTSRKFRRAKNVLVLALLSEGHACLFSKSACGLYLGDTDGRISESLDFGETWKTIAQTGPVSKGDHYRLIGRQRPDRETSERGLGHARRAPPT